ncbi:MAG: hypothetical protein AAGD07_17915 [Planctomycetota bacterium]
MPPLRHMPRRSEDLDRAVGKEFYRPLLLWDSNGDRMTTAYELGGKLPDREQMPPSTAELPTEHDACQENSSPKRLRVLLSLVAGFPLGIPAKHADHVRDATIGACLWPKQKPGSASNAFDHGLRGVPLIGGNTRAFLRRLSFGEPAAVD